MNLITQISYWLKWTNSKPLTILVASRQFDNKLVMGNQEKTFPITLEVFESVNFWVWDLHIKQMFQISITR